MVTLPNILGKEDGHTYQWTEYVKSSINEDIPTHMKEVQFKLHESRGNPLRVINKLPYEITETGWGEFELILKIFFMDPNERLIKDIFYQGCFSWTKQC